ncbi:retropepsin-like domain-containing protein [Candidatus Poribacteria bacterium]|nr:retropepsin-like domain-containing protein [Candidatus Poribacteria bacterium]
MNRQLRRYFVKYRYAGARLSPVLRFGLTHNQKTTTIEAYVDTGASFSIFFPSVAQRLDLDYRSGRLTYVRVGDGGLIPVYLHRLSVHIGHFSFQATVGFSDRLGVGFNLLGRQDIFEQLAFTFNDKYGFLIIADADDLPAELASQFVPTGQAR